MAEASPSGDAVQVFTEPKRQILNQFDLNKWVHSKAYGDYMKFLHDLNDSVKGMNTTTDIEIPAQKLEIIYMLEPLKKWIQEHPPEDMGSQRYGNKAFRRWYEQFQKSVNDIVLSILPEDKKDAVVELAPYLLDSFGNSTRIDYGSGHEASFLVFILCLYKIGVLTQDDNKFVVLRLFNMYLRICRDLQGTYKLEPAGSRGVHAIDDYQFLPFLFGSSQLNGNKRFPVESYTKKETCADNSHISLFFDAVNFIFKTKTGPFYEHSNQLWNISAVPNWEKVNSGMFKMYEAEVLRKFPVVQHFLFGSLFEIEKREDAPRDSLVRLAE
ncbi:hypothetical protein PFISCL1PPCAC_24213 [Pristionchus fissidentatus]|uniref:Serine/threonine-protein phosphatase 2A activator n=1 Tax=Pristionchus fissidentatus TaxID=1538716 RepID=A0AAV5WPK0_9BILA|nr:hypothetical protein PFISCL1PPCAC_24213 [Pristionchus fissidentatus]